MPSPSEILSDPKFQALPLGEQLKVMRSVDPSFAGLPPKEQGTVIARARQKSLGYDKIGTGKPGTDRGFFGTLASDIAAIPGAVADAVMATGTGEPGDKRPPGIVPQIGAMQHAQFEEGRKDIREGRYVEGAGHELAGAIPILGPAAAQAGEELGEGKYGEAAAHAVELLGPEAAKAIPDKYLPKVSRTVENVNNPVEEQALKSVEGEVRMTPGQRAGQRGLETSEKNLRNVPATQNRAERFYNAQEEDLAAAGRRRVQGASRSAYGTKPVVTNPYGAGSAVQEALTDRIDRLRDYADKLYDSTRQTTARNVKEVQTGTREVPASTVLDPSGNPAVPARTEPVMSKLQSPVDLKTVRSQLKPIYDELTRNLPEARRANSPAYRALDDLMKSDAQQMNAMDFDKFLGAVKAITRNGDSSILSNQSQRLARQVIGAGERQFQQAIAGAGPNVVDKLNRARKAVAEYHNTADFLESLRSEPGALYSNLTNGGDRAVNALREIGNKAPKALQTVGRTYLEEMMDKATREGGFGRSAGVKADWEKLGAETKELIFGQKLTKDMDDFLLAAKRLTPAQGSATADRASALLHYGDIGAAIAEFVAGSATGHAGVGAAGAAATLAKTRLQPEMLARLSFKPAGAQLLKQSLTLPINSRGFNRTMQMLNAMASEDDERSK